MENNKTIEILNGDKIVVNVNTFRHFINELIDRRIKGKGLSTNDFTNEDKTKLNSALTTNDKINANNIVDIINDIPLTGKIAGSRLEGALSSDTIRRTIIPGENINSRLSNAELPGTNVKGDIIYATIKAENIKDLDENNTLVKGIIRGTRIQGNIEHGTINGSNVIGLDNEINKVISNNTNIFTGVTIQGSQIQGSITNATINGSQIRGNIDVATIGGSQINSTISGSLITGDLTKALIHADKIGDTIDDGYTLGVIKANRLRGNLDNATISGSQVNGHLGNATIDASNVSGLADFIPTGGGDSTGIIEASRVSGELTNATIRASKIIDYGGQGELMTGVIYGSRIHGLLENAYIYGSGVSGNLTKANIDVKRVNNLNDVIGSTSYGSEIYYYVKAERLSGISNSTVIGSKVSGDLSMATISCSRIYDNINGTIISGGIKASRIQGNLTNATIQGSNIEGYVDVSKLQDTINNVVTVGKINAANISGGFLDNVLIPASTIHGELTNATIKTVNIEGNILGSHISGDINASQISGKLSNATIDSSNIEGTLTAESILADYSITSTHLATGAVLPENIASGNLQSGVKVNVNALVGNIPANMISGVLTVSVEAHQIIGLDEKILQNFDNILTENPDIFNQSNIIINADKIGTGNINSATIGGSQVNGTLINATVPGSIIQGNITQATINASQISGNINGDKITGTISGAFLDANKIFETIDGNFLMGGIQANRLYGDIYKEIMRSGFLDLCREYGVAFNGTGIGGME